MVIRVVEFSSGGSKLERFLPKNQHTQRKLLNFKNWCSGEVSKRAKIWLSKSIFNVKNHRNLSQFFFWLKNTKLGAHFLILTFFDNINFKSLYFLKWCPIFDSSPLLQFSKFNNLAKNLSNFVSLSWKLHNRYCHITCISRHDSLILKEPMF